jgi:hypothetical protein
MIQLPSSDCIVACWSTWRRSLTQFTKNRCFATQPFFGWAALNLLQKFNDFWSISKILLAYFLWNNPELVTSRLMCLHNFPHHSPSTSFIITNLQITSISSTLFRVFIASIINSRKTSNKNLSRDLNLPRIEAERWRFCNYHLSKWKDAAQVVLCFLREFVYL